MSNNDIRKENKTKKKSTLINFSNHESRYHIGSTIHGKNHEV
jgi:hypothetical protein